ncbi:basic proline-rich protein-like [Penaeus monodon]|uniref:basic proline-rich protein-like n=1 Tax=Penaeus monodon TaxID=6687 RepID=UPI0018A7DFA5|nr:basic proline-rich protein-like [Penaeus monodon]
MALPRGFSFGERPPLPTLLRTVGAPPPGFARGSRGAKSPEENRERPPKPKPNSPFSPTTLFGCSTSHKCPLLGPAGPAGPLFRGTAGFGFGVHEAPLQKPNPGSKGPPFTVPLPASVQRSKPPPYFFVRCPKGPASMLIQSGPLPGVAAPRASPPPQKSLPGAPFSCTQCPLHHTNLCGVSENRMGAKISAPTRVLFHPQCFPCQAGWLFPLY